MFERFFKKGQDDARQNKGAPRKFDSPQARDGYLTGQQKQREAQQQQQRQQHNKR